MAIIPGALRYRYKDLIFGSIKGVTGLGVPFDKYPNVTGKAEAMSQGHRTWLSDNRTNYKNSFTSITLLEKRMTKLQVVSVEVKSLQSKYSYVATFDPLRASGRDVLGTVLGGSFSYWPWFPLGGSSNTKNFDTNLQNRATLLAYSKLDGLKVQSAVTGGESKETAKLLRLQKIARLARRPAKTLLKLSTEFRTKFNRYRKQTARSKAVNLFDTAQNMWMEARYGWRPAVYEFASYRDLLVEGVERYDRSIHSVVGTQKTIRYTPTESYQVNKSLLNSLTKLQYVLTWSYEYEDKYSTHLFFKASALSDVQAYRQALGLTVGDIPSIAWELTPLSFVADWFVDTGLWLQAWKPKPGITMVASFQSTKRTVKFATFHVEPSPGYFSIKPLIGSYTKPEDYVMTLERRNNPTRSAMPTFNPAALNLCKQVDLLALTTQRISSLLSLFRGKRS